jgi:hypothetical protein
MLTSSDLLHLPYTPDLTEAGITFACRALASNREHMGASPIDHLRKLTSGVAVELSFRRYLAGQAVPYEVLGAAPFTHPDQYDLSLGGHRCMVKSALISHREQITRIRRDQGSLLQAPALLPVEQFVNEDHKPEDLYMFAFLLGVVAVGQADVAKAIAADQPVALIHPLPENWARPRNWVPLEKLALKSDCGTPLTVEIGGQDGERNFISARLELSPRQRVTVEKDFHSLAYLRAERRPEARIGIHNPRLGKPYLIPVHAWGNVWVYGMEIIFAGWLTHADFRRKASLLNAGAFTFLHDRTRIKNLMVPLSALNPLGILLEKVKIWEQEKNVASHVSVD